MVKASTSFEDLCNKIRAKAKDDVKQNLSNSQLVKWQVLLTAILETELAIHRVSNALKLLKAIPSEESLRSLSISLGSWIDYHYGVWSFWMCGLIDKEINLISQIGQKLIKPNNPNHKDITRPLIKSLLSNKDKVGKIRHPLAHAGAGGTLESIINTESMKDFLILTSPINWNVILNSCVPNQNRKYSYLFKYSTQVIAELYSISEKLNQQINWDNI